LVTASPGAADGPPNLYRFHARNLGQSPRRLVEVNLVESTPRNQLLKGASNGTYIGRSKQDGSGSYK